MISTNIATENDTYLSPLLRRDNTFGILNLTSNECKNKIKDLTSEIKESRNLKKKDDVLMLKRELSVYKNDLDTRIAITREISQTRSRGIAFFHFYKNNPHCNHKHESSLKDDRLQCIVYNSGKHYRKEYHNALNQIPIENKGIMEAYQPNILKRMGRKIAEKL